ncbi:Tyrosinase family protein [Lysobacter dokdonensis DS-58]|uniref:Tyrosinase family protein n=1 Tax=Lysobacter dokdonensis DS-58 TaxID=1300345 RepID=A0A0A2X4S5_9GAMM|nr:tyrosinase family protein [Lysobacter dokdonensis]KGQ20219.1 Tyrosinase family protein [Lysobacter dokdonensis DS-58]
MSDLTRRNLIKGIAATPLVFGFARNARAATFLRCDLSTPGGQDMLATYADAIRLMQAMGPENPLSWLWQWYTHFTDGATNKAAEIARVWGETVTPQRTLAEEVWNTCQSHAGQSSNFFLPWHRYYVFMLERIIRSVTGRVDFAMPYWNYTSADPAQRGVVPLQFRLPDDPVFGVLYRPNRVSRANNGLPIHALQPGDAMNIDEAMSKTNYSTVGSVTGFGRTLDSTIHGRIHTLVGNTRGMGAVPYAGNDPLFFVHHCNIDRMWASWNRNGNKNPTDAVANPWINNAFVLADERGLRASRSSKNLFSVLQLGYDYDAFFPRPPVQPTTPPATTLMAKAVSGAQKVASSVNMVTLGKAAATVKLARQPNAKATNMLGLDSDARRTYLVLRKLHAWKQPGVLFHVYLCDTPNAPVAAKNYVGNINFFDAEFHDHGGGSKLDTALGDNIYSFDVTPLLSGMAKTSRASTARDQLFVKIVPGGTPETGADAMIAQVDLIRQ